MLTKRCEDIVRAVVDYSFFHREVAGEYGERHEHCQLQCEVKDNVYPVVLSKSGVIEHLACPNPPYQDEQTSE